MTPVTPAEADAYFATRPKQAQIGAWASKQSQPLESRFAFEQAIAKVAAKHIDRRRAAATGLERLAHRAAAVEFWHDRPFRLHDRIVFARAARRRGVDEDAALSVKLRYKPEGPHAEPQPIQRARAARCC